MDQLKDILHKRSQSEVSIASFQADSEYFSANKAKNAFTMSQELDASIQIDANFLVQMSSSPIHTIYQVVLEFHAYDPRHLPHLKQGAVFVGLGDFDAHDDQADDAGERWIFGCREEEMGTLGFVPAKCLKYMKKRGGPE